MLDDKKLEMLELNNKLIEASEAYYNDQEIMSNFEYDALYDKLVKLEKETGVVFSNSVTNNVGRPPILNGFEKSKHEYKALSLAKTKDIKDILELIEDRDCVLSWKLDGLTVVLTYEDGELHKAVTRGDGIIGDDITEQAKFFANIPSKIPYSGKLIVRGEALIPYEEFKRIKSSEGQDFKNPRNLASGTVKTLDLSILLKRKISFIAFTLVNPDTSIKTYSSGLNLLKEFGFEVVDFITTDKLSLEIFVDLFTKASSGYDYPVDGLVVYIDELAAQRNLGETTHHPNYAIAFKWSDETADTTLKSIEWNKSRTGRINPVAVFDPVELDGSIVERASLHNIDYIESMKLNIGDQISVYKANMIIPQIAENYTKSLKDINSILPKCPKCGADTYVKDGFLHCSSIGCINLDREVNHFLGELKVKGFGEATITKLIDEGLIEKRLDIFTLKDKKDKFISIPGLGKESYNNLTRAIDAIKANEAEFLSSLGINGVSLQTSEIILRELPLNKIKTATTDELQTLKGIGEVTAKSITNYFSLEKNLDEFDKLVKIINPIKLEKKATTRLSNISNKKFVITGKLAKFPNRKKLQLLIESYGGINLNTVNSKTDYLINNDITSCSSKNKKAKELDVPIITEEDLLKMLEE